MNTFILTEGKNFKTFLEENYAVILDGCYLFIANVEHGIEHDVDIPEFYVRFHEYLAI